jgi:DNA adenine methylase
MIKSPLKWPGSKRPYINQIVSLLPENSKELTYIEPFLGGGNLYLNLAGHFKNCEISDCNHKLIDFWKLLFYQPENLLNKIDKLKEIPYQELVNHHNNSDSGCYFYALNRRAFLGLMRYSKAGLFNTVELRQKPKFMSKEDADIYSKVFNYNPTHIFSKDFSQQKEFPLNSFVICDPPYPESGSMYTSQVFNLHDKLSNLLVNHDKNHQPFMLFYPNRQEIKDIYKNFNIIELPTKGNILKTKIKSELLIKNY